MPPPVATYRLQFNATFGFDQATAIVPYLAQLGISHVYASPLTKARAGSQHGYDVVDYQSLNPELGDAQSFRAFVAALAHAGMGLIMDFVPNHMGVNFADNAWWLDVLERGRQSPYACYFDIDWRAPGHGGRLLLPILGTSYAQALSEGAIKLCSDAQDGSFSAWYYEHRLPIAPEHNASTGAADPIEGIGAVSAESLHCLLERQPYRLAHWRLAATDINYRRFFDISSLAGIRQEDPEVFAASHQLVTALIACGDLQGLRIDHVDGLYDPAGYFAQLRRLTTSQRRTDHDLYVVMEKILGAGEPPPKFCGVAGTTGYEWLNVISRLLLDARGLAKLGEIWHDASGEQRSFGEILRQSKQQVLGTILVSEFDALTRLLARIAAGHLGTRDHAAHQLRRALALYVLNFPIYRTYVTAVGSSPADRAVIERTITQARGQWIGAESGIFDFLHEALTLDLIKRTPRRHSVSRVTQFAMKVQQLTGPLMAKSLEDTAFYRYHRLIALNEVGGDPASGALPVAEFHDLMRARCATSPDSLTATATHDTKRGEDARARLLCLSEITAEWNEAVAAWRELNAHLIEETGSQRAPTAAHEYMLYQALLGAWPARGTDTTLSERMQAYAVKAAREGKEQSSWLDPSEAYEAALRRFVGRILDPAQSPEFLAAFAVFAGRVALLGALNSMVQLTLKCTMPGVPDFYQGTEFWDLSLVDPDNRRPVDFAARVAKLDEVTADPDWPALARDWADGRIKLALTRRLLALRGRFRALFAPGDYRPLEVVGRDRDEIVAFARSHGGKAIIVIVARLFARSTERGLHWPGKDWEAAIVMNELTPQRCLLTDRSAPSSLTAVELPVADLLGALPVAVIQAGVTNDRPKGK